MLIGADNTEHATSGPEGEFDPEQSAWHDRFIFHILETGKCAPDQDRDSCMLLCRCARTYANSVSGGVFTIIPELCFLQKGNIKV